MRLVTILRIVVVSFADAPVRIDDGVVGEHGNVALRIERIHRPHVTRHHVLDRDAVFGRPEIPLRGGEHGRDEQRDEQQRDVSRIACVPRCRPNDDAECVTDDQRRSKTQTLP